MPTSYPEGTFGREELVSEVLKVARADVEGRVPSPRQQKDVGDAVDPAIDELRFRRIVDLDPDAGIPVAYKIHLAEFVLFFCAKKLGIQPDANMKTYAERSIRAISSRGPTFEPQAVDPMMRGGGSIKPGGDRWSSWSTFGRRTGYR